MPIPFEGGCHCGSVRYVCSEEPITVVNCHCGDCQKIAGSAFITGVLVPEGSVEINGEMKSYRVEADSGNHITRNFCPACGTRILVELEGGIGIGVSYTTMDDNSWLEPAVEFYASKALPWITLCSRTEKLTNMT
ncbi:GFA family protein [Gammaproteobacteria bacterium]|nr:GFA family protein [Gammaproteobacteria bacterium]|tara:strand:- start:139 stop:543 length:405 start_codon:yes stop_codon:yes gene_type:complete